MFLRFVFCAAAAAITGATASAQQTGPSAALAGAADSLPVDTAVRIGTLPNGLRYYIRRNSRPEKRAELRLVVNAGSILENDRQLGLAHFIEHTAFNGTTHFAKNDLVKYLESIGVRFGADLNAQTSFDETVYILPIPTDTARIVDKAFQILEDWAHGQVFDSAEVVKERGVVREEWRGRKGASDRMLQQWLPVAFKGSKYATRLPIGTEQSIMSATPSRLRAFYRTWYRPDLMAVIAVGDFDPATIEREIETHFARIPRVPNATPRPTATVPPNREPLVAIATDKEATSSNVEVLFKLPHELTRTAADYRRGLVEQLYLDMLNDRLDEISRKSNAPFLGAGASKGSFFARTTDAFTLGAGVKDGGIERGLEALLVEARRVDEFGFLASELDRARQNMLRAYERAYTERDKTQSAAFVREYVDNYLTGEAIPGIAYEYALVQRLLPTITLAEVNALASGWITDANRVIIAESPLKAGLRVPTRDDLLAVFDRAAHDSVRAYAETVAEGALVDSLPPAGRIVAEQVDSAVGVTEWRLSNGVRVLVKPTDFKADEVLMSAFSAGGTSLAPDSLYMSAALAPQIVHMSGAGKFSAVDLQKRLSGKAVGLAPSIGETSEGLSGHASPRDLETLMQLVYLDFTGPRLDTAAYGAMKNQVAAFLANRGSSPAQVFNDTVQVTMTRHAFRARPLTAATFGEVDPWRALAFYEDRFADASDFTFVFVGNVDLDVLRPLVERYLATLPASGRTESWRDVSSKAPDGIVEKVVRRGIEPKAMTRIMFTGPFTYTPQNRFALRALLELFQIKLNETLREQLGGTYSPSVGGGGDRLPPHEYTISVVFGSAPENVDKLTRSTFALIDTLQRQGPSAADVDKVREQMLRSREVDLKQNGYWLVNIAARTEAGEPLEGLLEPYDDMIRHLTAAQIQQAARQYFDTTRYARFVLLPEATPAKP